MINHIKIFHAELNKGECLKIFSKDEIETYIGMNDTIETPTRSTLIIYKENGSKSILNVKQIIKVNVVKHW